MWGGGGREGKGGGGRMVSVMVITYIDIDQQHRTPPHINHTPAILNIPHSLRNTLKYMIDWLIGWGLLSRFLHNKANLGLEQWPYGQRSGGIFIIKFEYIKFKESIKFNESLKQYLLSNVLVIKYTK